MDLSANSLSLSRERVPDRTKTSAHRGMMGGLFGLASNVFSQRTPGRSSRLFPRRTFRILLLAVLLGPLAYCDSARDILPSGEAEQELTPYDETLEKMSWYDFEKRDYREFKEEELAPYVKERPQREASGGIPVFNPIIILWVLLGAVLVLILFFIFRNGLNFRRRGRLKEEDLPDLEYSPEAPRKRDPLFNDALAALEDGRYRDVMETLLEILVRFSHAEKYLSRRTGFTPREFQRLVRKVAPDWFIKLADDLSPAFEETVYALRPRDRGYYEELIHRMEKQLQGVGR